MVSRALRNFAPAHPLVIDDEDVVLAANAQLQSALGQLFLTDFAQAVGIACVTECLVGVEWHSPGGQARTAAQTQDLDVISVLWTRQSQQRGRKEHGLVVRVRNEEQDALVLQCGERGPEGAGVHPEAEEDEGQRGPRKPVHGEEMHREYLIATGHALLPSPSCSWSWSRKRGSGKGAVRGLTKEL